MADSLTLTRQDMKDPSTAHLRLYVGGLVDNTSIEDLYEIFSQCGQVNGIIVNRNFGFVQFETEAQAQKALAECSGRELHGKNINVRAAQTQNKNGILHTTCSIPEVSEPEKEAEVLEPQTEAEASEPQMESEGLPVGPKRTRTRTRSQKRSRRRRPEQTEVVTVHSEQPHAVALTMDNAPEETDDMYDNHGNFIGDQGYRNDDMQGEDHSVGRGGMRGRGRGAMRGGVRGRGNRGRPVPGPGGVGFRERSPHGEWGDRGAYDRFQQPEYPRALPVSERNDCEIIVVSKALTEYAEYIEGRLKRLGIVVDLLFPMEDVPIGKVLGNIASRGCLYAILVMPTNQEHRSLTLTILHGLPQEHRNMPLEDALQLLSRNFQEVQRGGPSGREAVYALLGQLADGRTLTVLQYDKVMEYLQERREQQVKIELGEPLQPGAKKTEVDLQQRILSILNDKKIAQPEPPSPAPAQTKLLNDPTVRRALDSILQKLA